MPWEPKPVQGAQDDKEVSDGMDTEDAGESSTDDDRRGVREGIAMMEDMYAADEARQQEEDRAMLASCVVLKEDSRQDSESDSDDWLGLLDTVSSEVRVVGDDREDRGTNSGLIPAAVPGDRSNCPN